ncbi:hypothetical protein pb186bvf_019306 [Paramecium bursaria]
MLVYIIFQGNFNLIILSYIFFILLCYLNNPQELQEKKVIGKDLRQYNQDIIQLENYQIIEFNSKMISYQRFIRQNKIKINQIFLGNQLNVTRYLIQQSQICLEKIYTFQKNKTENLLVKMKFVQKQLDRPLNKKLGKEKAKFHVLNYFLSPINYCISQYKQIIIVQNFLLIKPRIKQIYNINNNQYSMTLFYWTME